jgi:hypothetical protein
MVYRTSVRETPVFWGAVLWGETESIIVLIEISDVDGLE